MLSVLSALGLQINKVTGNSMLPVIPANSYILFYTQFRHHKLKVGDIVRVNHPLYGNIIKQICQIEQNHSAFWLQGMNSESVSIREMGVIKPEQISAKLLLSIKPK
ncbi:S24 family peptidase [Catenovulum sp. SX2]|uniref:S24 family peptidase n=1 Tax=Catenovulum sp. SX2 TaxID=3398614 RepID=UPI003F867751